MYIHLHASYPSFDNAEKSQAILSSIMLSMGIFYEAEEKIIPVPVAVFFVHGVENLGKLSPHNTDISQSSKQNIRISEAFHVCKYAPYCHWFT